MKAKIEKLWYDSMKSHVSIFTSVPDKEWNKLESRIKFLEIKKDDYFIRVGNTPDRLGFILSGVFRVFYETENGEDRILVFREENRFLSSYSSFLEKKESWFNIQALEDSQLLYIALEDYNQLLRGNPCWQILAARYAEMLFIEKKSASSSFYLMMRKQDIEHF
jgi:signal-transduction protein with cAMP-binding, CBS, and nucleotidyltransferase domain